MTATKVKWVKVVEIEANTGATTGELFYAEAYDALSFSGGASFSESIVNDAGDVRISFNPDTVDGGSAAVLRWLDELGVEYTARFLRWRDE